MQQSDTLSALLAGLDLSALSLPERRRLLTLLRERERLFRENRLARYRPYPKQAEFHAAGSYPGVRERLLIAANQVGKTLAASAEIAMHLTGLYPDWWRGRRFSGPVVGWAGGVTAESTRDNPQRLLLGRPGEWGTGMIPAKALHPQAKSIVRAAHGVADAVDHVKVRYRHGGVYSLIYFKHYSQGREKWQGESLDFCIAEGQRVLLADGRFLPIEQVEPGMAVLTVDGRGRRVVRKVVAVHDKGEREIVDVETSRGPWIRMTPDHEVFTDTRTKVPVAKAEKILLAPSHWEPEVATCVFANAMYAWLGLVIAEGTISQRKVTMGDGPAMQQALAMLPAEASVRKQEFKNGHVPDWYLRWPDFWALVPDGLAHEKTIPDWVFMSPNHKVALFLSFLFSGDGWASGHGVGYTSTSRLLVEQISILLWRLGVRSSVTFKPVRSKWRAQWSVHVTAAEHVLLFSQCIRIVGKEAALAGVTEEATRRKSAMPSRGTHLARTVRGSGDDDDDLRRAYYIQRNRAHRDRFATIQALHPAGTARVYDLSIEKDHRFIAGLGVVSNCWLDEECPEDIYFEALTRTNATRGMVLMTFTPLLGMSSVVKRFLLERAPGTHVTTMTLDDAEHYTKAEREAIAAGYPPHEREARTLGIPSMGSGRVFPVEEAAFVEGTVALQPWWPRIAAIDFGWDHPTAVVWMAWDRDEDVVHVYDCYRVRQESILVHAAAIRARGSWIPMAWPHDGRNETAQAQGVSLAEQYRRHGVNMLRDAALWPDGSNGVEAGIMDMLDRMQTGRLRVAKHLEAWWEEFRIYHRRDGKLVKQGDDLMSATRYGLMMLRKADIQPSAKHDDSMVGYGVLDMETGF